jgi:AraC-like DNA-binding protein
MDIACLNDTHARYPTENISKLWELAVIASNNPTIGVASPNANTPECFDVVAYTMMSCANLLAGLERLVNHLLIVSNTAEVTLTEDIGGRGTWLNLDITCNSQLVPRQRYEFSLTTMLAFCRWVTRSDLRPLSVELSHATPSATQAYIDAFKCPVHFESRQNRMLFSTADLMLPLPTANPTLAALHDRYAGEYLERLNNTRLSYQIRELIIRCLPNGDPLRSDIARTLCMSERTVQRRLQEEGTSYCQLVDDTRRYLAKQYLEQSTIALEQISYLLGFKDQSTFSRACKRWFDIPPGQYRSQLVEHHSKFFEF